MPNSRLLHNWIFFRKLDENQVLNYGIDAGIISDQVLSALDVESGNQSRLVNRLEVLEEGREKGWITGFLRAFDCSTFG